MLPKFCYFTEKEKHKTDLGQPKSSFDLEKQTWAAFKQLCVWGLATFSLGASTGNGDPRSLAIFWIIGLLFSSGAVTLISNPGKFPEFPLQQPEGRRQAGMVIKERAVSSLASCIVFFLFVCFLLVCFFHGRYF